MKRGYDRYKIKYARFFFGTVEKITRSCLNEFYKIRCINVVTIVRGVKIIMMNTAEHAYIAARRGEQAEQRRK